MGEPGQLSVAATGGYGRGVLAPFSDIDLLFLTTEEPSPQTLRVVEYMLYFLWDLGLKVGHATRSIEDCLVEGGKDTTIRTALLDARYHRRRLRRCSATFTSGFRQACKEAGVAEYIAAKQDERAARHRRYGDSPFLVEPNIKEGRGGLRDLQTLYWIARYVYDTQTMGELADVGDVLTQTEARHGRRAWEFLWTVRFHLHYVAGRAEERLTFDMQPVVGARMGYTRHGKQDGVERFMRHYFLTAREVVRLTRILEPGILRAALGPPAIAAETDKALLEAGFLLAEGKLLPIAGRDFDSEPIQMLRILQVARDRGLELHPLALRSMIQNERRAIDLRGDHAGRRHLHGPDVRPRAGASSRRPSGRPASGRRALAGDHERDRLPRPFHSGLGSHRRADAVRHLPRLHRRRAHDRGDPRAERDGARRAGGDRAGRVGAGGAPAIAPRAVSGDADARHRQGPRRRPFASSAPSWRWRSGRRWG